METTHENEFGKLMTRFVFSMVDVEGFHDDVELATRSCRTDFLERGKDRFNEGKSCPPLAQALQQVEQVFGIKGVDSLVESTTQNSLDALRIKSDAASLVFGHSLLDGLLSALCKLSCSINPIDWFPQVVQRPVKVEKLLGEKANLNIIVAEVAQEYVNSLERESLIKKATLLHSICKPSSTKDIIANFTYSESDLKDFDRLRHDIVHGLKFRRPIPLVKSHLEYARLTGIYFLTMIGRNYSLKPQPSIMDIASI